THMRRNTVHRRYVARRSYRRGRRMRQFLSLLIVVFIVSGAIFLTYAKKEPDPQENTDITQTQDGDSVDTTVPQEPEDEISRGEKPVIPTQPDDTQDPEEGTGETAGGQTDGDA